MAEKITIDIDVYPSMKKLEEVEEKRTEVENAVDETEKESMRSFQAVMGMARTTWIAFSNIVRASGGTIDTIFRLTVQTALSGAQILVPLFTSMEMTPMFAVQATIGLTNIALMLAAVGDAMNEQKSTITQFRALQYTLMSVSNLIGYTAYL